MLAKRIDQSLAAFASACTRLAHRLIPRQSFAWRGLRALRQYLPRRRLVWYTSQFLDDFAREFPAARFIQIGSNDGQQQDPLCRIIERYDWRGILVEPVPYVFERLRQHRAGNSRLILENVAIAAESGTMDFHFLPRSDDPELPRWYNALGSFRREVVERHAYRIPDIAQRIETLQVPCLSFTKLCERHGFEQVDLVHTDVEGYDWTLIQSIDFERYLPAVFIYEHHHQDAESRAACRRHMESLGYTVMVEGLDSVAVQRTALSAPLASKFDRYRKAAAREAS